MIPALVFALIFMPANARFAVRNGKPMQGVLLPMEDAMKSPFVIYFAGVGTVVAALAVGFGGGLALTSTSVVKESAATSAARAERLRTGGEAKAAKKDEVAAFAAADTQDPVRTQSGTLLQISTTAPLSQYPTAQPAEPARNAQAQNVEQEIVAQKKEAAERRKAAQRRQQFAERQAQGERMDAERRTSYVRTYEARSRGFFGLFGGDDDD